MTFATIELGECNGGCDERARPQRVGTCLSAETADATTMARCSVRCPQRKCYTVTLDRSLQFRRRKARPPQFRRGRNEPDSRAHNSIYRRNSHYCAKHDREIQVARATTGSGREFASAKPRSQIMPSSIAASSL